MTITVTDPNTVFSGTNTVVVSRDGTFPNKPSGALEITTTSWSTIMSHLGTGKRVLLKRGQTWDFTSQKFMGFAGPGILGAFGDPNAARPTIRYTSSQTGDAGAVFMLGSGDAPGAFNDFRFMDLHIDGNNHNRWFVISNGTSNNITFLRVSLQNSGAFIGMGPDVLNWWNTGGPGGVAGHTLHSGLAIVDTEFDHMIGDGGVRNTQHIAYLGTQKFLFLGNNWNDSELGEHVLRIALATKGIVAHNRLTNARIEKHIIKFHAIAFASLAPRSDFVTIADNYFESELGDWYISIGPQNGETNESVHNIILERNHLRFGPAGNAGFHLATREVTVRNNTFILTPTGSGTAIAVTRRGIEPAPDENYIYNNSAYNGGTGSFNFVSIDSVAGDTYVYNNLAKGNGSSTMISGTGATLHQSNNSMTSTPGWVNSAPTLPAHFALASGSAAINSGTAKPVFDDYNENSRLAGTIDRGASEFNSGPASPTVSISVSDSSAAEPSNDGQFTVTASPAPTSTITVNLTRSGTATNSVDYTNIPTTVNIGTSGTATIPVDVINDSSPEGTESVILTLNSGTGYVVGSQNQATINIVDDDIRTATIAVTDASAGEPSNPGTFRITVSPAPTSTMTVNLNRSGTAMNGVDYSNINTTASVGTSGFVDVAVSVINDSTPESTESVTLDLATGSGYVVGSPSSATINITDDDSGSSLPTPWTNQDVGAVGTAGSASHSSGTFTVNGSGSDVWGTADEFHFVHQAATGDCEIRARVVSVQNTSSDAKAGVMIRDGTAAGARHAFMELIPSGQSEFIRRTTTNGSSSFTSGGATTAPYWVRLVRSGSTFTAYKSSNGTTWTTVGTATITMNSSVRIGLAVSSRNDGTLCTGVFDNVTVTP